MLSKNALYHKNTGKVHRVAITIFLLSLYCLETTQPSRCSETKKQNKKANRFRIMQNVIQVICLEK